mmetsp:Transcript_13700/g.27627  ORF Transcript_13700/g.27627 Transcript_13700/m.27627 type:complete len:430 (-) Transcript_13700:404-1693(-)
MAYRRQFMFSLPLGRHLCKSGLRCELWTNDCCASWVPDGSPIKVMPLMGDGAKLRRLTDVYKGCATMGGDSDAECCEYVPANMPRALEEQGISPPESVGDFAAEDAGKELFGKRLRDPDVAAVVWEGHWAAWAAALAKDAGVPTLGLGPTYLYQFRAFAGPLRGFDGECRVRDRLEDRVDADGGDFAWVIAKTLTGEILPPDGYSRVGAFIPSSEEQECLHSSPDLDSWLAASESEESKRPVTFVSLGSQNQVCALSGWAETDLLKGCLAASPRVLAVSKSPVADPELVAAAESGRLRIEAWVPQFAVLGHHHVQCFVSHCGANSTHEGLSQGVPIVPLPFFDDQLYIAPRLEELFGYAAAAKEAAYRPLRKSLLRRGPAGAAVPHVAAAVRLGLAVPHDVSERLKKEVREEAGVETVADMVMAKAGLK